MLLLELLNLFYGYFQQRFHILFRSSRLEMFFKIDVLKNFGILIGKQQRWSLFLLKLQALTLFRTSLFGVAHGIGGKKAHLLQLHISHNDGTWHSYTLSKEDPENIWITWHSPWVLLTSAFFHRKSANFAISRNTDLDCVLIYNF